MRRSLADAISDRGSTPLTSTMLKPYILLGAGDFANAECVGTVWGVATKKQTNKPTEKS